jgi:hypothetical protein
MRHSTSAVRLRNFFINLEKTLSTLYGSDEINNLTQILSDSNMFDTFVFYKIFKTSNPDERIQKIMNIGEHINKLVVPLPPSGVEFYIKWILNEKFCELVNGIEIREKIGIVEMNNIIQTLWHELNFDLYMQQIQPNIVRYQNNDSSTSLINFFQNDVKKLSSHLMTNFFWVWFIGLTQYFIENIFSWWIDEYLRTLIIHNLQGKEIIDRFESFGLLPFTIRCAIEGKLLTSGDVDMGKTLYEDDRNYLFYYIFDPQQQMLKETPAVFARFTPSKEMTISGVLFSPIVAIKNYYNANEKPGSTDLMNAMMNLKLF